MPFVHIASQRLAPRAIAAAALAERGTTEAERAAAEGLVALIRQQGVVAVPIEVHPGGREVRLSDDGLLFVHDTVWWVGLLLCGLAPCYGFDVAGQPVQASPAGAWRVWVVGPPAAVDALRLAFASCALLAALALRRLRPRMFGLAVDRLMVAMTIGVLGISTELARESRAGAALVVC